MPLTVADQHWNSPTLDIEQDALLLLPSGVVADVSMLAPERELAAGRLFRAAKCGLTRVANTRHTVGDLCPYRPAPRRRSGSISSR